MSRNIKDANGALFASLDRFCATKGVLLANAGAPRWISSKKLHRHFLTNASVSSCVHFTPAKKLAKLDLATRSYLCTIGFERNERFLKNAELENNAAFLTVALSELKPRPKATISEIRQIVEAGDKDSDEQYQGHDYELIADLFPPVFLYEIPANSTDATWNIFFQACVDECETGYSWIEGGLAAALRSMCDLDQNRIPYKVLCRSVFDGDKSSFYLALYRCLEALYAYSSAHGVANALNLSMGWGDIAAILEDKLGWHPREEGSLIRIMRFASSNDLHAILQCLKPGVSIPVDRELMESHASKAIYGLRNVMVHYRPSQHAVDIESYDWTVLCEAMVGIIVDVYEAVFEGKSA